MDWIWPWVEKRFFRARRWGFEVEDLTGRLEMKRVLSVSVGSVERVSCWTGESSSSGSSSTVSSVTGWVSGVGSFRVLSFESLAESLLR